jgi:hypothetical protein
MNKDLIRHKVLGILVKNYNEVRDKYGDPDIHESAYDKLEIPIEEIIKSLKISYPQFNQISTKAIRDRAFKIVENRHHTDCCMISSNTFLFYNEKVYLKDSRSFYQKSSFWTPILAGAIGACFTLVINSFFGNTKNKNRDAKQQMIEKRLDSLIQSQKH